MGWREQLQKGSFRGAPFLWQRAEGEVGRKTARHDYPQRDEAYIEDLGKAPREFTLEVFVLGSDYMAARDKLIAALEEPGPGTLVHPTMGSLRVALSGRVRISESTDEGGMARFTIPLVLAGDNKYPTASADTAGAVVTRADAALGKTAGNFGAVMTVGGKPGFVADDIQAMAGAALTAIDGVRAAMAGPLVPQALTKFQTTARQIQGGLSALIRTPLAMAGEFQGFMAGISTLSESPLDIFRAYRRLFGFGADLKPVPLTTPNRIQQAANRQALVSLVQGTAVIEAARTVASFDFTTDVTSYQEAAAIRTELADRLDALAEAPDCDDATYQALTDLRAAVVRDITARGADLARIVSYAPRTTLPALVVAHMLYGDAAKTDVIIARNRLRHPGFVPGGRVLEVLTDA
jgi:prophage DNA circulation protein